MAFNKVYEGYYNCLQSDIDLFSQAEEGTIYCCTDSGAIYKGVKSVLSPSYNSFIKYKLIDTIKLKDRKVNPVILGEDVVDFGGRKIKIRDIPQNLAYCNRPSTETVEKCVRTGNEFDNTDAEAVDAKFSTGIAYSALPESFTIVTYGNFNSAGVVFTAGSIELSTAYSDNWIDVNKKYFDPPTDLNSPLEIDIPAGAKVYITILDSKFTYLYNMIPNVGVYANSWFEKAFFAEYDIDVYESVSVKNISKEVVIYDLTKYDQSIIGRVGLLENNQYSGNGRSIEELTIPKGSGILMFTTDDAYSVDDEAYVAPITVELLD